MLPDIGDERAMDKESRSEHLKKIKDWDPSAQLKEILKMLEEDDKAIEDLQKRLDKLVRRV